MMLSSTQTVPAAGSAPTASNGLDCDAGDGGRAGPDRETPTRVLLVAGMHRSGTSALARALSLMGGNLPDAKLVPAGLGNSAGHWEPQALRNWSDRTLGALAGGWDDWRRIDADAQPREWREAVVAELVDVLATAVSGRDRVVLKDPRLCRLAPLLFEALDRLALRPFVVLAFRNPVAVMDSLSVRDAMIRGYAGLLWLRHMLEIEERTRGLPRCVVNYDDLLSDWRGVAARLRSCGAPLPTEFEDAAALDAFLTPGLRHHDAEPTSVGRDPDVSPWLRSAHEAFLALSRDPDDSGALAAIDATRAPFEQASAAFAPSQTEHYGRENRLFQNILAARAESAARAAAAAAAIDILQGSVTPRPT